MGRTFASLKFFNYRVWFFAALVANLGLWMQRVAQNWLVLAELTNNNQFWTGVVTAFQFLPTIFVMPIGGALADRFDKRHILLFTQVAQAVLGIAIGTMVLTHTATVAWVCIFAFLLGCVVSIDNPPRLVFITELVPARFLPNAVGLNSMSFNTARLLGPALGGVLIKLMGTGQVLVLTGVMFSATVTALFLLRGSEYYPTGNLAGRDDKTKRESMWTGIKAGMGYVHHRGDLVIIFVVLGLGNMFAMNLQLTTATMARTVFNQNAAAVGFVGSIVAVGSLTGAIVSARRTTQPRVRNVVMAAFGLAVATAISAVMPNFALYCASVIPAGFFMLMDLTGANTAIQMSTIPAMRGRVMALYQTVSQGVIPLGALITGWISEMWGARWGVGVGAIVNLVAIAIAFALGRNKWNVQVHYKIRHPFELEILGPLEHEAQTHPDDDAAGQRAADRLGAGKAEGAGKTEGTGEAGAAGNRGRDSSSERDGAEGAASPDTASPDAPDAPTAGPDAPTAGPDDPTTGPDSRPE